MKRTSGFLADKAVLWCGQVEYLQGVSDSGTHLVGEGLGVRQGFSRSSALKISHHMHKLLTHY